MRDKGLGSSRIMFQGKRVATCCCLRRFREEHVVVVPYHFGKRLVPAIHFQSGLEFVARTLVYLKLDAVCCASIDRRQTRFVRVWLISKKLEVFLQA